MKISTKGRYGVAAMYDLAVNYGQGPVSLKSIAQRQKISENYLEQLVSTLRKAGYVKSIRGAQGGYNLSKPSSQITVGQVLRALEGPMAPSDCVLEEDADCENSDFCVTKVVWQRIKDSVDSVIDSVTLKDMVLDHKLKSSKNNFKEM